MIDRPAFNSQLCYGTPARVLQRQSWDTFMQSFMQSFSRQIQAGMSLLVALLMTSVDVAADPLAEKDFIRQVMGQPQAEVRNVMGDPDRITTEGKYEYWIYHDAVRDMISDKTFRQTQVLMIDGRVADSIHSNSEPKE